jgi:serine/threonine-protein kinase ATR
MQKNRFFLFFISFLFATNPLTAQWNPNAGVVASFTDNCTVTASSTSSGLMSVIDNDFNTSWQSGAPLPTGFMSRADQNFVLGQGTTICSGTGTNYQNVTDGDGNTAANFSLVNGKAKVILNFGVGTSMFSVSSKMNVGTNTPVNFYAFTSAVDSVLIGSFSSTSNYNVERYNFPAGNIVALKCYSDAGFQAFEIAIMATLPQEWVTVDLGSIKTIGQIQTRHWSGGGASAANLYVSSDNINWTHIANLVHDALQPVISQVVPTQNARYIKVAHTLNMSDWNKVFMWEIDAFGPNGMYGVFPTPKPSSAPFKEVLGVNGIWGWGNNAYSSSLGANQGPNLYNKAARHARNYHAMDWDVTDPDTKPDYVTMAAGGGTQGQWWLNWDQEYVEWVNAGLEVQASIQFFYPASAWDSAYEAAYDYGFAFAKHFGLTYGTGHIPLMEVGNEPWDYDSTLYRTILRGMAKGAKDADPAMKVIPCALQAGNPNSDLVMGSRNYMGTRITPSEAPYLDGINVHAYSYVNNNQGVRTATYPENPNSDIRAILPNIHFRDQNMPNKPIYWSEFGWDTDGAGESCTHDECVSERAGTAYAIRAAMMGWRWGIDRMTWFFYANDINGSSLYSRSGLTSSKNTNFQKKKIFTALEALLYNAENLYFLGVEKEDSVAWIYTLGDSLGNPTHLIAWRPILGDSTAFVNVDLPSLYAATSAVKLEGLNPQGEIFPTPTYANGKLNLAVNAVPILIALDNTTAITASNAEKTFSIYPNPTENDFSLQSQEAIEKVIIWDNFGRKVYENNFNSPLYKVQINAQHFAKGLYVCEILTANKARMSQKLWVK